MKEYLLNKIPLPISMQFVHSQNDTPRETRIVVIDSVYAVDTISLLDVQNKQFIEVS